MSYYDRINCIQQNIFDFLSSESNQNFEFFNFKKYLDNGNTLKETLHFITKISNNHHRNPNFFNKIEYILKLFQEDMKKFFSNFEIFNIFKSNKRLLLFLFEEGILIFDKTIYCIFKSYYYQMNNYTPYFLPEIKSYRNEPNVTMDENQFKTFEEKRKIGENDNYICHLIRNDLIDDFVIYVNKTNFSITSKIEQSIFETNSYLLKNKETTLIEYAAFFGSIQIFNYLRFNNVEMNSSLWLYSIHSNNPEIIHILEENHVEIHIDAYKESIKCHHIDIMNYIKTCYSDKEIKRNFDNFFLNFKYFNFREKENQSKMLEFMCKKDQNFDVFYNCCKYDYLSIVEFLLNNKCINNLFVTKLHSIFTF